MTPEVECYTNQKPQILTVHRHMLFYSICCTWGMFSSCIMQWFYYLNYNRTVSIFVLPNSAVCLLQRGYIRCRNDWDWKLHLRHFWRHRFQYFTRCMGWSERLLQLLLPVVICGNLLTGVWGRRLSWEVSGSMSVGLLGRRPSRMDVVTDTGYLLITG